MRYLIYIVSLFLLVATPSFTARAEVEDGAVVSQSVVAPLMAWVERETGVRVPALPPVVASHERFSQIISTLGRLAGRPKAMFTAGTILLDSDYWDPEDSTQQSILLHELVHYAQSFMRHEWACSREKEYQAYTLQNKWLQQTEHTSFVTVAWIDRMASCPGGATSIALASSP